MTAMQNIRRKHRLLAYGATHKLDPPKDFNAAAPKFGSAARAYTKKVQKSLGMKQTGLWSLTLTRKLTKAGVPTLLPVSHKWQWRYVLGKRIGKPPGIVWHHAAGMNMTVEMVHRIHLDNGWSGIGYHCYTTKRGVIHRGRPEWAIGAHAKGFNEWLGICAEGNYEIEKTMPVEQLIALKYVHAYLNHKYGSLRDRRHKDLMPTACPGQYYPYREIVAD